MTDTATPTTRRPDALASRRGLLPKDPADRRVILVLLGLAALAFLVRLIAVLRGGGLGGNLGFDDGVYFGAAIAFATGQVPYLDFNLLHPPGILYALVPFGALGGVVGDPTAFAAARLSFMVLGALNTFLVGMVARPVSRSAAISAAAIYAVWSTAATVEQTTWTIGPQTTLLLFALLALAGPRERITTRRVLIAGGLIGVMGMFQIWAAVPAVVIVIWLLAVHRRDIGTAVRRAAMFCIGGTVAALVLLVPLAVWSGGRMIQLIIFTQLSRNAGGPSVGKVARIRMIEGIHDGRIANLVPDSVAVGAFALVLITFFVVAWKRPQARLWLGLLLAKLAFLAYTVVFYHHYGGWIAPETALLGGTAVAMGLGVLGVRSRRVATGLVVVALIGAALLAVKGAGQKIPLSGDRPDLTGVRCVTADSTLLLIETGALRRNIENGCAMLLNPGGLSNIINAERPGPAIARINLAEYQAAMVDWYTSGDAAMFVRLGKDQLTPETWAAIKAELPVEEQIGRVTVLRREAP